TFNTTGNVNYTAASIKYNYTISAYKFLIAKVNSTAYETSTQGYAYEINVSSLVGNVILEEDGIAIASLSPTGTLPSAQWFNFTYAIPLLAVNNTAVSFNAVIDVSNTLTTVNSTTQHLLQNYFTSGGPKNNPILTGSGETFFINITQVKPLNAASVLNATLIVGNQTVPLQTVLPYKYYFQYSSFVPSLYGLANPAGKTPTAYTTKGTIKLGFDGSSAYRNLTLSPLTIYNPYLVVCNSTTPKAFSWSFYNASNLKQITTNTLISGYFVPKKGLYTGNIINGTAAGFTAAASNDIYSTCIYPSWASFSTYGTFLINNANYSTAQFMLNNQATNNVSTPLKIYLQQITNPSSYDIVVENGTNNFISAIVQEELYNFNLNNSVLVNEFQTPSGGGYVTNLQTGDYYLFKVYNNQGALLNTTQQLRASCAAGTTCIYYIEVANTSIITPVQYLNNLKFSCSITNNTIANTSKVSCSLESLNGAAFNTTLAVYKNGLLAQSVACEKNLVSAALSLSCTVNDTNTTAYTAQLWVMTPKIGQIMLYTKNLGYAPTPFGNNGLIIALIIVMAFGLIFAAINPAISVILGTAGFIASGVLGLFVLGAAATGFLIVFAAIVVFSIIRRS
ncbi:MAG: hypothetical protein QW719_03275, partial [Candidatus Micrarchaeaceae archaeon]